MAWSWLAVPFLALVELAGHYHFASAAPPPEDWTTLREPLGKLHRPGDLVVVAPYWAEPNARAVFGDGLMPLEDVARPDETAYPRIIELSILGQDSGIAGLELREEVQEGSFRIRVYENKRFSPRKVDFADRIDEQTAQAVSLRGQRETPCKWNPNARVTTGSPALHGHPAFPKKRFECGRGEWNFVGVTVIEDQRYRPHRCIWAHPGDKQDTVVRFPKVELGKTIRGHGGLSWFLERETKGTKIEMQVSVGDERIGVFEHADGDGWSSFEFDTSAYEGQERSVEFRVSSKRSRQREFCFHASVH
jgi:hypothetical protein